MKISEFNYQEKPISFYHLDHGQLERSSGHNSGEFLRQLLNQDLSLLRKQMALLKQPQLVAISQPIAQYHLLTGQSSIKRDEEANEQRPLGQTAQRTLFDGMKIGNWRSRYSQEIEWQEAT